MRWEIGPITLSAFTGAGGLDLGLEAAGFNTVACVEWDPFARQTIQDNRPNWRLLEPGDIAEVAKVVRPWDIGVCKGGIDILAAGPPCQPFSKAGQWSDRGYRGTSDPRSKCIFALVDLVRTFLPTVLLIENVPGFVAPDVIKLIQDSLEDVNSEHGTAYELGSKVLNAADFGVPQRRLRAFLVAHREGKPFQWPGQTHADSPVRSWDAIGHMPAEEAPVMHGKWSDLLPSIPEGKNYLWHTSKGGGRPLFGYRTRYWSFLLKLSKTEPAWTLPAQPGPATGPFHWDNRPLTVREMQRIQTFPLDWSVSGNYRTQVRQIGNATPPLLAEVIGRALGSQFFNVEYPCGLKCMINRANDPSPASEPEPVPTEYLWLEGVHASHPGAGLGPKPRANSFP